jgi:hypothetical protein
LKKRRRGDRRTQRKNEIRDRKYIKAEERLEVLSHVTLVCEQPRPKGRVAMTDRAGAATGNTIVRDSKTLEV